MTTGRRNVLIGLGILAGLGALWYSWGGGSAVVTASGEAAKALILLRASEAGLTPAMGQALVANAYAESGLRSDAVGDYGHSIGLFQLYDEGLGEGIALPGQPTGRTATLGDSSVDVVVPQGSDPRFDPSKNIAVVIDAVKADGTLMGAMQAGAGAGTLAAMVCERIERPANAAVAAAYRATLVGTIFGPQALL